MALIKRIVLDVLKPHLPRGIEFSTALAELGPGYKVNYKVIEVDEKTETVIIAIEGDNINFDLIRDTVSQLGGSLHSVDEIVVLNENSTM